MTRKAAQGIQAVFGQVFACGVYQSRYLPVVGAGGDITDDAGYCLCLAGFGELFQVGEVYPIPAQLYGSETPTTGGLPLSATEVYGRRLYKTGFGRMNIFSAGRR